jgi:hypothetical protein
MDYRFSDKGVRREMEHGYDFVFRHNIQDQLSVADIAFYERPPLHGTLVPGAEIIDRDRLEAGFV